MNRVFFCLMMLGILGVGFAAEAAQTSTSYSVRSQNPKKMKKSAASKIRGKSGNNKKISRKQASAQKLLRKKTVVPKLDTVQLLDKSLPNNNTEVTKVLDAIEHIRTYYAINKDANIKDLQSDERFKTIYSEMDRDSKRSVYLYLKGIYENSAQAIKDQAETPSAGTVSDLKLNRNFRPSKSDVDGFNEKTSIKSKLVRRLQGKYFKPEDSGSAESKALDESSTD